MNKTRRIGAAVAATVAAIGMTMTVATAPASAAKKVKGPQPVSQVLGSVDENSTEWAHVWFKTDAKVCDFKLRVWDGANIDVSYPKGKSYTSLKNDSKLRKGEVDYASFKLTVGEYAKDTYRLLFATTSFTSCGKKAPTQIKHTSFLVRVDAA
jgi:hypothetical protein